MARHIPDEAELILDVGCGLGAGTWRLEELYPRARVVGINVSPWQVAQAKKRGVEAVVMDATARVRVRLRPPSWLSNRPSTSTRERTS